MFACLPIHAFLNAVRVRSNALLLLSEGMDRSSGIGFRCVADDVDEQQEEKAQATALATDHQASARAANRSTANV